MIYIGIPTVNLVNYLQETLASIKSKHDFEILLVDNGSNDGKTREWIESSGYDRILNEENVGVSKAWNQIINWGLSHNGCDIVFILNNDIVLHEMALDYMLESVFECEKDAISGVNIGNKPVMLTAWQKPIHRYSPAMNFSCFGLTAQTIKRVGLFDENFEMGYFEDNDYHQRIMVEGLDSVCDMYAQFTHYGSRTIKEGGVQHEPYFTQNREYFKRKWGFSPDGR